MGSKLTSHGQVSLQQAKAGLERMGKSDQGIVLEEITNVTVRHWCPEAAKAKIMAGESSLIEEDYDSHVQVLDDFPGPSHIHHPGGTRVNRHTERFFIPSKLENPRNPRSSQNNDAVFGEAVYAGTLEATTKRVKVAANNYFDILQSKGVDKGLLQKTIDGKASSQDENQLEEQIRKKAQDLWDKSECYVEIFCKRAVRAKMPPQYGGKNRDLVVIHCGSRNYESVCPIAWE